MRVLLIIPAYNEAESIEKVVHTVTTYAQRTTYKLDYIIINDGSVDDTEKICRQNGLRAIHLLQNLGIGGAVQTGYLYAKIKEYDIAVQFDGDGQHDITYLDKLVEPVAQGSCDFSIGSRFLDDSSSSFKSTAMRRFGIRFLSGLIRLLTGTKVNDPTSGFRAANRNVISYLAKNYPVDYPEPESIVEITKKGFRIQEIPVNMLERENGTSSIRAWKSVYYMIKVSLAILCTSFQRKVRN